MYNQKFNKILIVDDDQINLFVLGKYLEAFGIEFKTAFNGQMAIELIIQENNYTLIVMDCNMPIMNGFDAMKRIKELVFQKVIDDIPILALTANTSNKDIDLV